MKRQRQFQFRFRPQPFAVGGMALALGLVVAGVTPWVILVAFLSSIHLNWTD